MLMFHRNSSWLKPLLLPKPIHFKKKWKWKNEWMKWNEKKKSSLGGQDSGSHTQKKRPRVEYYSRPCFSDRSVVCLLSALSQCSGTPAPSSWARSLGWSLDHPRNAGSHRGRGCSPTCGHQTSCQQKTASCRTPHQRNPAPGEIFAKSWVKKNFSAVWFLFLLSMYLWTEWMLNSPAPG